MKIVARRPGPLQFASWGRLPTGLVSAATGQGAEETGDEALVEMARFMKEILCWCCLDPRVPEEIEPKDIPWGDAAFVVRWAMRAEEARALEGFRGGAGDAGGGGDGAGVREAAVGIAGD
jgi:hypothetical protein